MRVKWAIGLVLLVCCVCRGGPAGAEAPWEGLGGEVVYCVTDQWGGFWSVQAEASVEAKSARVWGHRHDAAFPQEDPRWVQGVSGSAYYVEAVGRWQVSLGVTCVDGGGGCASADVHVSCDYEVWPWACGGWVETRSGARGEVRLTGVGVDWAAGGVWMCRAAHP